MTDQPYATGPAVPQQPTPTPPPAPEPVTTVDGELLDPAPRAGHAEPDDVVDVDEVIEGEAVDVEDDSFGDAAADEDQYDVVADDEQADDDSTEAESGDVLVLETWQIQLPATGDAAVDAALARLTEVEGLPPSQHADVYEAVHAGLQEALADLDRS